MCRGFAKKRQSGRAPSPACPFTKVTLLARRRWVRGSSAAAAAPSEQCHLRTDTRSEEHTSELQSQSNLVCRLLLEKKKNNTSSRSDARLPCSLRIFSSCPYASASCPPLWFCQRDPQCARPLALGPSSIVRSLHTYC